MIILDATDQKIQIVLAGAITTNQLDWNTSYVDVTSSGYTPGSNNGTSNNTSAVDIVGVPGSSTQRQVKQIVVYNNDTAQVTLTVQKLISATPRVLVKVVMQSGDMLQYNDSEGFRVLTPQGGLRADNISPISISAGTQSANSGVVIFSNSNGMSFGMNGSLTVTGSFSRPVAIWYEIGHAALAANPAATTSNVVNLSIQRVFIPYDITATRLDLIAHLTVAGSTNGTWSISAGVYTRSGSTLNSASTTQSGLTFGSGGATTNTNSYSGISGTRVRSLAPASWAFTPGEYWFGFINSVQGPAGTTGSVTIYGQSLASVLGTPGGQNDVVGNYGVYTAGTGAFPSTINIVNDILYCGNAAGTASVVYRQPYFRLYGTY